MTIEPPQAAILIQAKDVPSDHRPSIEKKLRTRYVGHTLPGSVASNGEDRANSRDNSLCPLFLS